MAGEFDTVHGDRYAAVTSSGSLWTDVTGGAAHDSTTEDDPRHQLDELRERIRSGDLSHSERDQLDQLVFVVALADRRADTAVRDFPGEVAVQRALAAEAWSRVSTQLRVMLGQMVDSR